MLSLIESVGLVKSAPRIKLIIESLQRKWGKTGGKFIVEDAFSFLPQAKMKMRA